MFWVDNVKLVSFLVGRRQLRQGQVESGGGGGGGGGQLRLRHHRGRGGGGHYHGFRWRSNANRSDVGLGVSCQRHVVLHSQVIQNCRVLMLHVFVANLRKKIRKKNIILQDANLADVKLFHQRRVAKVVLVFLGGHVVRRQDVLLEHELLRVLLPLAHDALV